MSTLAMSNFWIGVTIVAAILVLILVILVANFGRLYILAWSARTKVRMRELVGMWLRRVNSGLIVNTKIQAWKAGTVGVGSVVGDGGRDVEVGVSVGVATGGVGGEGEVGASVGFAVGERGGGVALGTGSVISTGVGEPTGTIRVTTGVGLG